MAIFPVEKVFVKAPMDLGEDPRSARLFDIARTRRSRSIRIRIPAGYRIAIRDALEMAKHSMIFFDISCIHLLDLCMGRGTASMICLAFARICHILGVSRQCLLSTAP